MYELNLPKYGIKIKNDKGHQSIFDVLRRKYVALTPGEEAGMTRCRED